MPDQTKATFLKQQNDLPALLAMLENEPDWMEALDAADALAQLGEPRGLERLILALGDPDQEVRQVAREILTELDDPRGNQALQQPFKPADVVFQHFVSSNNWQKIIRVSLFLVVLFAAVLYMGDGDIMFLFSGAPFFLLFPAGMLAIPYLLLSQPIPNDQINLIMPPQVVLIALLGWYVYFLLMRFGVKAKKPLIFVAIYILFLLLVFGNVAGCTAQMVIVNKLPFN